MKKGMILISFALVIMTIVSMSVVFATNNSDWSSLQPDTSKVPTGAESTAKTVLGFVQFVGYAIAIGMLIYVGIKYVMASADEKANLKNAMIRYVIGAVLIAGATAVAGWIFEMGKGIV